MNITIAICSYNRCESLRQTLESLRCVRVPENFSCELIVVDNASTDETAEVVRACTLPNMSVRYIYEPRRGVCYARNTAVSAAGGEVILFTDDDVRLPHNWIEGMCAPIRAGRAHAVAGGVKIAPHLERSWMTRHHYEWVVGSTENAHKWDGPQLMIGANMAFSREVLAKVPGFDPELGPGALGFWDETLFANQLNKAGYRIVPAFDVVVEHHFDESRLLRSSLLENAKKRGRGAAYIKHHWEHQTISFPQWRLAKSLLRLAKWRIMKRSTLSNSEGITGWEMWLVFEAYRYKQYLTERKRSPNYNKHGLRKLTQK